MSATAATADNHSDSNNNGEASTAETNTSTHSLFDDIDNCIDEVLNKLRLHFDNSKVPFRILGVGISSFVMNLIGIHKNGTVGNEESTLSYACNSSEVVQECIKLKCLLGEEKLNDLYQNTGTPLHNSYAVAQLRAYYNNINDKNNQETKLEEEEGESTKSTSSNASKHDDEVKLWTTISSYCIQQWTGNHHLNQISFSEASWTGLFNFHSCKWDERTCDLLPLHCRKALPTVGDYRKEIYFIEEYCTTNTDNNNRCDYDDNNRKEVTNLRRKRNLYWERWPELRSENGCRLILGFGDGICANIGSKCSPSSKRIACTIGTSAAMRVCIPYKMIIEQEKEHNDRLVVPFGLFCYRLDSDNVLVGGALTDGGSIIEFLRKLLNLETEEAFLTCLEKASLNYHMSVHSDEANNELSMIPFLSGERSTGYRGGATGCVLGLTRDTTSSDLLQVSLQSVILRLCKILELIERSCGTVSLQTDCIIASGNALELNKLWRNMLSDCTGKRVVMDSIAHEGTSRGAALLVSSMVSIDTPAHGCMIEEPLVIEEEQMPNPNALSFWSKQKERQDEAIMCLSPTWN